MATFNKFPDFAYPAMLAAMMLLPFQVPVADATRSPFLPQPTPTAFPEKTPDLYPFMPKLIQSLEKSEGFREETYRDIHGVYTIGIGFTKFAEDEKINAALERGNISKEEANKILEKILISTYIPMVKDALGPSVFEKLPSDDMRAALVDLAYNGGTASRGLNKKLTTIIMKAVAAQESGHFDTALVLFQQASQKIMDDRQDTPIGLQNRGRVIAERFEYGAIPGIEIKEEEWPQVQQTVIKIATVLENPTLETLQAASAFLDQTISK